MIQISCLQPEPDFAEKTFKRCFEKHLGTFWKIYGI